MKKQDINTYIYLTVAAIGIYLAYDVILKFLEGVGLKTTKAEIITDKKVTETVSEVAKEIKQAAAKLKKPSSTMTAAQRKLAYTPTYSNSYYLQLADALYEAFNHVGTNGTIVKNTMELMKKRLDVLKLIAAYGVRQTYVFGLKDGAASNLIGHLVSEDAVDDANEGLKKFKVYYTF
jgi:hypothetical protein